MYELTKKLRDLEPYQPIVGNYKIRLDANESFIRISDEDIQKAVVNVPLNRYPDPYAIEAVNAFGNCYGVNPDFITAGNGSDELISIITACFFEKGDKVLCFAPDFSMYSFYPYLYELDVEVMDKNPDLTINIDKAIAYVNDNNIKSVLFSNPCNPTSLGLDRADVVKLITSTKALIILDEAYMDFWDEKQSLLSDIEKYDNVIILKTCSKALAMAGIRLGFAVASTRITKALRAAKSPYNVNVLTQAIGSYILSDKESVKNRIKCVVNSAKSLYNDIISLNMKQFEEIYVPVTNFVFIKTPEAKQIYEYLLGQSIAIRFMGKYIRISCGSEEENKALIRALAEYK